MQVFRIAFFIKPIREVVQFIECACVPWQLARRGHQNGNSGIIGPWDIASGFYEAQISEAGFIRVVDFKTQKAFRNVGVQVSYKVFLLNHLCGMCEQGE